MFHLLGCSSASRLAGNTLTHNMRFECHGATHRVTRSTPFRLRVPQRDARLHIMPLDYTHTVKVSQGERGGCLRSSVTSPQIEELEAQTCPRFPSHSSFLGVREKEGLF